ncbi:MAG: IS200/IS605 family accessory protein TnpB-related protein [Eubacterium sp.]|nr:IS200/IS605 family accessory protein TnpB-related protein [Eubacterium sp.]
MKSYSTYKVKIREYNCIFKKTVEIYREAVDFYIAVCLREWKSLSLFTGHRRNNAVEKLSVCTKKRPEVLYDFSKGFYKFPSYLRRAAIAEALGKCASYMSSLERYEESGEGSRPGYPRAGHIYPALYRDNTYVRIDDHTARIKVYIRNTWDWVTVKLRKTDVDYILRHCAGRKECVPTLRKRGKEWFLDFAFEESCTLDGIPVEEQTVLAVDLGINQACVCSAMRPDGTVTGRYFLSLHVEKDRLDTAVNRIKKAQQKGAGRTPRLWGRAKGINKMIAVKTAAFIIESAKRSGAHVIVFEHLDRKGKKRGRKKQRLHLWRSQYIQSMVMDKAHRLGIRVSRINAWKTSALAYDGSGYVERGINGNYSLCRFQNGKEYHCDLNASYNIGARYFIREIIKSLPETERLGIVAKVPGCTRRSTCTLSTLYDLCAAMAA